MKPARIPPAAIAVLFRQLASAQRGGLPLHDALAILSRDAELARGHAALISDLASQLAAGKPLSGALDAHRASFAPEAVELVRAGENGRALPEALELLAADYEQLALQRSAVRGALAWPAAIVVVLVLLVALVLIFVIPAFKQVFTSFGADLPDATLLVMAISGAVADYWYVAAALVALAVVFAARGAALPGRAWIDRGLLCLPFVRPYLVKTFVARVSRALGAASESRLPLPAALAYLRATAGNLRLAESAASLEAQLRAGKGLAAAVHENPHLPGQLAVALELGERSNSLAPALRQLVAFSEGEAARSLMRLQQAILIGTYICLGIIVAFVVIALYLPIFKLGAAV